MGPSTRLLPVPSSPTTTLSHSSAASPPSTSSASEAKRTRWCEFVGTSETVYTHVCTTTCSAAGVSSVHADAVQKSHRSFLSAFLCVPLSKSGSCCACTEKSALNQSKQLQQQRTQNTLIQTFTSVSVQMEENYHKHINLLRFSRRKKQQLGDRAFL